MTKIKDYAPEGTKDCEFNCKKEIVNTPEGPLIICRFCERIVRVIKK